MADRFWVGGSANWDGTAGLKWALTSGGAGGQAVPTSSDDVFFDAASGAVTVTESGSRDCASLNFTGFTGTFTGSGSLSCYGSLTLVAGMTWSFTGDITMRATATGKTITTAGKALGISQIEFNGVGGGWTLQDNMNNAGANFMITAGAVDTNGKQLDTNFLLDSGSATRSLTLGASTVNVTASVTFASTGMTITPGTSTINCSSASITFAGNGLTFNNVNLTSTSGGTRSITGANTFNSLNVTCGAVTNAVLSLGANQTVSGTFTMQGNSASNRPLLQSDTVGTARTITAATVSVQDLDFQDITGAGAGSWTGTRLGDCKGNSGITFTAAANKYYVGNTANWNGTVWALSSGGPAAANNFPLPQDTSILDAGSFSANGQTLTLNNAYRIGSILASGTDQTYTLAVNTRSSVYGDLTLDANASTSGTVTIDLQGRGTQTITSAGKTWTNGFTVDTLGGSVTLADALTLPSTQTLVLTRGTLNMNGKAPSVGLFASSNSNTRAITSGGATLTLTGNNATIFNGSAGGGGITLNDSLQVDCTYSGAVGTRTISTNLTGFGANFKVSAGTDSVATSATFGCGNLDFTGFSGTFNVGARTINGSLTLSSGMTLQAGANTTTFAATSGTKTITSNGKTMDFPITFNGVSGTWQLADAMTVGSTRTTTLTNGTLDVNGNTLSTGRFSTSNSNARTIKSTAAGGKIATTDTTAATVFDASTATNLTVTRNSWSIEIGGNTTNIRTANLGAGVTWPALSFTNTTASGELDIVSSGAATTIKSLAVTNPPQTIKRTAGTTITVEDENGFPSGTAGNLVTIGSLTAASHTWTKTGTSKIEVDYLSISRSTATPSSPGTWYASTHSTDGGNNSGWLFRAAPDPDGFWHFFSFLLCIGLIGLLMGCAGDVVRVRYVAVPEGELAAACPSLLGRSKGCTHCDDALCTVYAPAPKNVEDEDRLLTIGHEFYCHAWLKQPHYDKHGVRKDPSRDCVKE